uniref:Uncharacterized protein n=1 Tax=Tanacetum cinerariifolium TaxID=118510 RepID=A0A6L2K8E0_TANCI|nr:hypothetical protein [Tanacetum cinerariifolium]
MTFHSLLQLQASHCSTFVPKVELAEVEEVMRQSLSMQDTDEAEVEEVIEVVTAAKLITEVVTTTATTAATTITTAQVPKVSAPRRRRGVVIQDPEETATASVIDEAFARQLEAELNANINRDDVIEQKKRSHVRKKEASKRKGDSLNQDAAKKQRINEEEEELKAHLQIVVNDDDNVFTEATPLASKPVVDYQIYHENNKPYYKIIRADGTHKLFISFITLLKNFNREDLEMLWKLVQERFQSSEPKNFSDDFLLNTLKIMFEKPNVEANIWKDQKSRYGLAKVKSWKLFESCGVHIITLTTTQIILMILLVEKKYHLTRFTLKQMLNSVRLEVEEESEMSLKLLSVRLEVEEESEMSLKLLRLMRRQLQEGYIPE